jgi:hypothetical protein
MKEHEIRTVKMDTKSYTYTLIGEYIRVQLPTIGNVWVAIHNFNPVHKTNKKAVYLRIAPKAVNAYIYKFIHSQIK